MFCILLPVVRAGAPLRLSFQLKYFVVRLVAIKPNHFYVGRFMIIPSVR